MADEQGWREPETLEAWGRALDAAAALLLLDRLRSPHGDSERSWPAVDRARCDEVLEAGRARGMFPHDDAIERYVIERAKRGITPEPERDLRGLPPR